MLPDGNAYDGVTIVTLTDSQFNRLRPALFTSDVLDDLGSIPDPGIDADFVTEAEQSAALARLAPIVKRQGNMANITLSTTLNAWADVEPEGTAAARPMDVVFPDCVVGQWIEVAAGIWSPAVNGTVYLDVWTIKDGVPINKFSGDYGAPPERSTNWLLPANAQLIDLGNPRPYQIQSADIDGDGNVRCRLRSNCALNTAARQIIRGFGHEWILVGRGPFG